MKLGAMKDALPGSLADADLVFCYGAAQDALGWSLAEALAPLGETRRASTSSTALVQAIAAGAPGPATMCW